MTAFLKTNTYRHVLQTPLLANKISCSIQSPYSTPIHDHPANEITKLWLRQNPTFFCTSSNSDPKRICSSFQSLANRESISPTSEECGIVQCLLLKIGPVAEHNGSLSKGQPGTWRTVI
ncbi:hypothetical protein KIL84_002956 [Mauremys mutica]|uniref:Uncharacterized protein n=1 Tax=Mauremys mutica TaxID=74926 RepID=A0A9D4AQQ5_9SAUR|nr:hypothetical protein KIL84_002956 [Mauremys mutica]